MSPDTLRVIGASVYALAVTAAGLLWLPVRLAAPVLLILVSLPLLFRLVPRNLMYGWRTPRTLLTTEEVWYRQNVIAGAVMVLAGVVWLAALAMR